MLENICYVVAAYLIGSIPFGFIAGKICGIDLREHGSFNIGATNAVRVLGKAWGIPVFICDFLKGMLPLFAMKAHLGAETTQMTPDAMLWFLAVMFALVLGHTFTCFLGFKGGKGVATSAGALFAISPLVGGTAIAAWILGMIVTRYVSLSSMLAGVVALITSVYVFICDDGSASPADWMAVSLLAILALLVIVKHRSNISRLLAGTEPKAFSKK